MKRLKIPYGISNFEKIKTENYYFVDKTKYIEVIEETGSPYLFFLRPRRFGKSLFVSMLEHYYDIARKEQFEELFGDTYIGKNPTPLRNSYPILKFNFSMISTHGTLEEIRHSFFLYVVSEIDVFIDKYSDLYNIDKNIVELLKKQQNTGDVFTHFHTEMKKKNISFYLIIDEYDNFANNILAEHGRQAYISSTHGGGFLRSFFAIIKGLTDNREIDRLFITGVSPLVMADVTSGFNIGDNISLDPIVSEMVGLNFDETKNLLEYYQSFNVFDIPTKDILPIFDDWYNGYSFSSNLNKIYNTVSVLYFVNQYLKGGRPYNLIDTNLRTDYGKLRYLLMEQRKLNGNFKTLTKTAEEKETNGRLIQSFSLDELISPEKFQSLLFYLGFTTIKYVDITGLFTFVIPNKLVDNLLWEYVRKALDEVYALKVDTSLLNSSFNKMAQEGEWKPILQHIIDKFYEAVSLRDFVFHEEGLKTFMLAWLNLTDLYDIVSEKEKNKGFADITLTTDRRFTEFVKYDYIIELKYIKADAISTEQKKEAAINTALKEATTQLAQYATDKRFTTKKIAIIASAKELLYMDEVGEK